MPTIRFDQVEKSFGSTSVIAPFSAEVEDREFLVLLGPSGCGKSTMLRMIAGLTEVTGGEITFDGRRVNELEPKERDVAFVFQSYALYPNMTVRENIAFPLLMQRFRWWHHIPGLATVMRRVIAKRPDVSGRVDEVARMLELTDYLGRRPKSLSGGQRQRVAVARSLVRDPELYLLDEPLSNLDAKLRGQMRNEITALYRRVKKTFVYVTHDQVEAMTMATRIIVLNAGRIQQIGTPQEVYENPANTFVARFIGSPGMNLFPMAGTSPALAQLPEGVGDGPVLLGVRPENVRIGIPGAYRTPARVVSVEQLGGETVIGFVVGAADDGDLSLVAHEGETFSARVPADRSWAPGARCSVELDVPEKRFFDLESGDSLPVTTAPLKETR
jgi:multiple sugar transport system ATP-binding protein